MFKNHFASQSTADALQAEVRALVSTALDQPQPQTAVEALCFQIRLAAEQPDHPRHPLPTLRSLLRRGLSQGATDSQLRRVVTLSYQAAVSASRCLFLPTISFSGVQQTVYGSNVIHVDFQASRMALSPFGDNAVRHPNSRLILRDVGMQEVSHPDFRLPKSSGGVSRRTSVTNSVTAIRCDVDTDGDGDPPPSAPTPALLLPVAA